MAKALSIRLGPIRITVLWPVLVILLASILLCVWRYEFLLVPCFYFALLAHELAHVVAGRLALPVRPATATEVLIRIINGKTATPLTRALTRREVALLLVPGPLVGISVGVLVAVFAPNWIFLVGGIGIALVHAINLVPIKKGSDGDKLFNHHGPRKES